MSTESSEDEEKKSGTTWLSVLKAILTGLVTILTALGVSSCLNL